MQLKARITDMQGTVLRTITHHAGIEVIHPLCDSRTAKVNLGIYDPALAYVLPGERFITITYGPFLCFRGPIVKPIWRGQQGIVEVNCHDITFRLKHHNHRYGDGVVDEGYPLDGLGLRSIVESAVPLEVELDGGFPELGIVWGYDETTHQGPKPQQDPPLSDDGLWGRVERGANVWETVINLQTNIVGPDFDFEPIDSEHPNIDGRWEPYWFAQMHTFDKLQRDKTEDVFFQFNYGSNNLEDFTYEPDMDEVRNYMMVVNPGGERGHGDTKNKGSYMDDNSRVKYGYMMGWESAQQKYSKAGLESRAKAYVEAYAYPPDYFTLNPRPDDETTPMLYRDFRVGDVIRAGARKGYLKQDLYGRIIQATMRQRDQSGGANVELECVPNVGTDAQPGGDR